MVSMKDENELCPYCHEQGKYNRLVIVQSTWKSAIVLCSDPQCIYPLDKTLHAVERDWSQLGKGKNDTDKEIFAEVLSEMKQMIEKKQWRDTEVQAHNTASIIDSETAVVHENSENFSHNTESAVNEVSKESRAVDGDDDEFNSLLDYLAKLPNNAFSSFSELSASRVHEVIRQQNEILRVLKLPAIVLPDNGCLLRWPTFMNQRDGLSSMESFSGQQMGTGGNLDKSEPRRYPQWSDDCSNLSWLTAGIALVVHCRLIRCVLKSSRPPISNRSMDLSKKDCISAVCASYELAMQKFLVAITLCNKAANPGSSHSSDSGSGYETLQGNSSVLSFGDANGVRIPRPIHQRIVDHLKSCQDLVHQSMIENKSLANHPADVLAFLLNSHESLKELSVVSFKSSLDCGECSQRSVSYQAARAVTIELSPSISNFSFTGPDCCSMVSCSVCGAANQRAVIEWQTFSPLLFLHFPVGLPDGCSFETFRLNVDAINISQERIAGCERFCIASRGEYQLRVTAVVSVSGQEDDSLSSQYITWVRRGNDSWMPCREALGKGSHIAEWDPLSAPRSANIRRSDVRILFFEAVPASQVEGLRKSRSSGFLEAQRPPSVLQQRYLRILRQRRKEATTSSNLTSVAPGGSTPCNKNLIQRFLLSEVEHKALLSSSSSRFEPYTADTKAAQTRTHDGGRTSIDEPKAGKMSGKVSVADRPRQTRATSASGKRSSPHSDLTALSLWPTAARPKRAKANSEAPPNEVAEAAPSPGVDQTVPSPVADQTVPLPALDDSFFEGLSAKDSEAIR